MNNSYQDNQEHRAPKKALGQHFLTSQGAVTTIIESAELSESDIIIEIGPGRGVLTSALLEKAGTVIAIEKDRELVLALAEKFQDEIQTKKLHLIEGSAEDMFFPELTEGKPYKVVANIPYNITGILLRHIFDASILPTLVVLLVQKEVAERIARAKKESILSLSIKVFGTPLYIQTVKAGSFFPAPSVDSAILKIKDISLAFLEEKSPENALALFFFLIKKAFSKKRKLLISNLSELFPREKLTGAFLTCEIEPNARAEDIPLEKWLCLTHTLSN